MHKLTIVRKKSGIMQCYDTRNNTDITIPVSEFEGKKALNNLFLVAYNRCFL
jgi:hypothetical protein